MRTAIVPGRLGRLAALLLLCVMAIVPQPAQAETGQIRFVLGPSLTFLIFAVMEHDKLVEKHVQAAGLPAPKVTLPACRTTMLSATPCFPEPRISAAPVCRASCRCGP